MAKTDIFKSIPEPAEIPRSPKELQKLGEGIFKFASRPKNRDDFGLALGEVEVGGEALPYVDWQRNLNGLLIFKALDRRKGAGGFGLIALRVPPRRPAVDVHVYAFGESENIHGARKLLDTQLSGIEFREGTLRNLLLGQLALPVYMPQTAEAPRDIAKAVSTLRQASM